jgi:hypothetical protein
MEDIVSLQQSSQLQENFHIVISLQEQVARLQEVINTNHVTFWTTAVMFRTLYLLYLYSNPEIHCISGTVKAAGKRKSRLLSLHHHLSWSLPVPIKYISKFL